MWDVARDDPSKLYQGATANKMETDRLLKRLESIRKDKADEEARLKAITDEEETIQKETGRARRPAVRISNTDMQYCHSTF